MLGTWLLLNSQDGLSRVPDPNSSSRAGIVVRVAWSSAAWAQLPFFLVLQKMPGSLTADQASCPGARAPAPAPLLAAILPEAPAALGAPGVLDGAGAGARAKGQDGNAERWGLRVAKLRTEGWGG